MLGTGCRKNVRKTAVSRVSSGQTQSIKNAIKKKNNHHLPKTQMFIPGHFQSDQAILGYALPRIVTPTEKRVLTAKLLAREVTS